MLAKVRAFAQRFGYAAPPYPPLTPDPELVRFRSRLLGEEFNELKAELEALTYATDPRRVAVLYQNVLKELCDLCYVAEGTAVAFGLPFDEAFAEVHASNMTKDPADPPGSGKAIKGAGYVPANMSKFVYIIESEVSHEPTRQGSPESPGDPHPQDGP